MYSIYVMGGAERERRGEGYARGRVEIKVKGRVWPG